MKINESIWDDFTNQYSLSKTLRFELKPVGKTAENIKNEYIFKNGYEFIKNDLELFNAYNRVKKLIDCYHRYIIDEVLFNFQFTENDLKNLNILYNLNTKNKENIDEDEVDEESEKDFLKKYRNKISSSLDKKNKKLFDSKLLNLSKNKKSYLELWMDEVNEEYLIINDDEKINKDELRKDIKKLQGKFGYFKGFNENRKNVYSSEKISTSIPFRIIHDNFPIFKNNIKIYEYIKENHPELIQIFDKNKVGEIFKLDYFNKCLTQKGIDIYNNEKIGIIGKKHEIEQDKGLNQIINEYVQRKNKEINLINKERKDKDDKIKKIKIPVFKKLKKQILSISKNKSFKFDVFEDSSDIIKGINECYNFLTMEHEGLVLFDEIKSFLKNIDNEEYDFDNIYINKKSMEKLSKFLFNNWRYIEDSIEKYYDGNINKSKTDKINYLSKKYFSIKQIQDSINFSSKEYGGKYVNIIDYFKNPYVIINDKEADEEISLFEGLVHYKKNIDYILNENYNKDLKEDKQKTDVEKIKVFLDILLEFNYFLKYFLIRDSILKKEDEKDHLFYNKLDLLQEKLFEAEIISLYNQSRNYITQKPYTLDKFKLMFGESKLLENWPEYKDGILLKKDGLYYLGFIIEKSNFLKKPLNESDIIFIMKYQQSKTSQLIQSLIKKDDKVEKLKPNKVEILEDGGINYKDNIYYGKIIGNKYEVEIDNIPIILDIKEGKVNVELELMKEKYLPPEINDIRKKGSYRNPKTPKNKNFNKEDLNKYIDYYKKLFSEYTNDRHVGNTLVFKDTKEYSNFSEFTDDIDVQSYEIKFEKYSYENIIELVDNDKLILFQIHNKDYNIGSKGNKNLHTLYWEMLFDNDNLKDVIFKLSANGEMFFRKASYKDPIIHKTGEKVSKKFYKNNEGILEPVPDESIKRLNAYYIDKSVPLEKEDMKYINNFSIIGSKNNNKGIIKNERFTYDKLFFHCPIEINFKKNEKSINRKILEKIHKRNDIHIIGLDRGERHLIYLTLINKEGKIIDNMQFSLNELKHKSFVNDTEEIRKINYQKLLDLKEKDRLESRKNWKKIENIKNLKEGYLSLLIHELAKLAIEKNAIIVMENLNYGFKDSRTKVEKQIYQKFELMLIKKLQYLVLTKNLNDKKKIGGILKGYQLSGSEIPSYKLMSKQNGIIFYVPPDYTSKIDPVTGFINLLDTRYYNITKSQEFFDKFDEIKYDSNNKYFRFKFDYKNYKLSKKIDISKLPNTMWTICSHSIKRSIYDHNEKKMMPVKDINKGLISLFEEYGINYRNEQCFKKDILKINDADFFKYLLRYLNVLLSLRHTYVENGIEYDTIISSVENVEGSNKFFVSMEGNNLPANADANGAYNIARKGLWILNQLDKEENKTKVYDKFKEVWCKNEDWLTFVQEYE